MYKKDEWMFFQTKETSFRGKIISVDESGRLIIEHDNGSVYAFNAKEIAFSSRK